MKGTRGKGEAQYLWDTRLLAVDNKRQLVQKAESDGVNANQYKSTTVHQHTYT